MKKFSTLLLIMMFGLAVNAQLPVKKLSNPPAGTFKKARNGTIVQYDKNGKKIGVYKIKNGKYVQVK